MRQKIMLLGPVGHGKTTLIQTLLNREVQYHKTQDVVHYQDYIDTPGEFFQHRRFNIALQATAHEAKIILFVLNTMTKDIIYAPNYAHSFNRPVIGVLTHVDLATDNEIERGRTQLKRAGVKEIFEISSVSKRGIAQLLERLEE